MTADKSPEAHAGEHRATGTAGLLWAWLGPATVWFIYLNVQYALVHLACTTQIVWPMHVVTVLALAGTVSGGTLGLQRWRSGARSPARQAGEPGPAERERRRLLAGMSVALSALFTILVVMQWLPAMIFHPCQQ